MLTQLHASLWVAVGEMVRFFGAPYPTRCVIVRFGNGDLWIWSPVKLTDDLRADVRLLGSVRHLVSPNKLHHLYLQEWSVAFPEALLWGPPSTIAKCSDLAFSEALNDSPPREWGGEIDQAWFRGSIAMDEMVFLHRQSGVAIVADLIQTFSDRFLREHWGLWRFLARLDGITEDQACAPLEWRLSFMHRAPARRARNKVLSWQCKHVVVAHGELPSGDGAAVVARSFRWLGP